MSFYVEVHCDVGRMDDMRCRSFNNDNPHGRSSKSATEQARKEGWKVNGRRASCPHCLLQLAQLSARITSTE